jgi:hypothetical protein
MGQGAQGHHRAPRARGAYEDGDPRRLIVQVALRTNTPIREVIGYHPRILATIVEELQSG